MGCSFDIKSQNILLSHEFRAKIADVGLAQAILRGIHLALPSGTSTGTLVACAPLLPLITPSALPLSNSICPQAPTFPCKASRVRPSPCSLAASGCSQPPLKMTCKLLNRYLQLHGSRMPGWICLYRGCRHLQLWGTPADVCCCNAAKRPGIRHFAMVSCSACEQGACTWRNKLSRILV